MRFCRLAQVAWSGAKMRALGVALVLAAAMPTAAGAVPPPDCHLGIYRLGNGETLDVDSAGDGMLRWLKFTGERGGLHLEKNGTWSSTYGWTERPDGKTVRFSDCSNGTVDFNGITGHRLAFDVMNTAFMSDGVKLAGRLVMPKGSNRVPVVVLVHGSEHDSALDNYAMQRTFPAQGIGVFVYDKRGTGISGGTYTQDFNVLAGDAVAALKEATRLAGARLGRIGYQGGSEAGWVVPLAASRVHADFAIISFGLAVTVLQEDQESVALDMHLHHHSAADSAKALEL